MSTLVTVLHVIVCLFLMLTVLLQSGKGGGMGAAFGGGNTATVFGGSGASGFLKRLTAVAGTIFMMTSMVLAYIASSNTADALERFGQQQEELRDQKEKAKQDALKNAPQGSGSAGSGAVLSPPADLGGAIMTPPSGSAAVEMPGSAAPAGSGSAGSAAVTPPAGSATTTPPAGSATKPATTTPPAGSATKPATTTPPAAKPATTTPPAAKPATTTPPAAKPATTPPPAGSAAKPTTTPPAGSAAKPATTTPAPTTPTAPAGSATP